jgi:hypothetical protein
MHAQHGSALRAGPSVLINEYERFYAELLNGIQVFDHTRSIFVSVAFIQVFYPCTRKFITLETILIFFINKNFAIFDLARQTGFHFQSIIPPAARTMILFPDVSVTEATIYPAWGNEHLVC